METNEKQNMNRKPLAILLVTLLLVLGVAIFYAYNEKHQNIALITDQTELRNDFNNLNKTLETRNAELAQLKGKNEAMDKTITDYQKSIEDQKKQIAGLLSKGKLTKDELVAARRMLDQYKGDLSTLKDQVAALEQQKQQLTQWNQQLTAELSQEKQNTSQLASQNQDLSKQVEVGSLLPVTNIDVEGVRTRIAGREVSTKKAKSAEALKIAFETGSNKLLQPGSVDMYVRVINPKGETISVADQGSGVMESHEGDGSIPFSKKADINYDQKNKKVVMYWTSNINTPGTYKVELYQSGYMVGKSNVTLN